MNMKEMDNANATQSNGNVYKKNTQKYTMNTYTSNIKHKGKDTFENAEITVCLR